MCNLNIYPKDKEILCTKTVPIDLTLLNEFKPFIQEMKKFVEKDDNAVGLSANQVWTKSAKEYACPRIFVMGMLYGEPKEFINPTVEFSGPTIKYLEQCLSRPGKIFHIKRAKNCSVHYYDLEGKEHVEKFGGTYAQIIGHEMQHLDGGILKKEFKRRR